MNFEADNGQKVGRNLDLNIEFCYVCSKKGLPQPKMTLSKDQLEDLQGLKDETIRPQILNDDLSIMLPPKESSEEDRAPIGFIIRGDYS